MAHDCVRLPARVDVRGDEVVGHGDVQSEARALLRTAMGQLLRELREARGWSQPCLARRAGVPLGDVTRLERGEQPYPALESMRPVVAALGFDFRPFINAVAYRAVVLHADTLPPPPVAARLRPGGSSSLQARRSRRMQRALHALVDELWARVQDRGQAGGP